MLSEREETTALYDAISEQTFRDWFNNNALLPTLSEFVKCLPKRPTVLDLGCGTGGESNRLIKLGAEVTGVDLSTKSIQYAIDNIPEGTFHVMDILNLTFQEKQFDGIMEAGVLFHFTEEEQIGILKKLYTILIPTGFFLSYYPEGNNEGMRDFQIGDALYRRYERKIPIEKWIETVESTGFTLQRKLDFNVASFKALLFKANIQVHSSMIL